MDRTRCKALAVLVLSLVLCSGCACMSRDNRAVLNWLDEGLKGSSVTSSTGTRVAAAPVFIPAAYAAFVVDAVVVHPISVIPDAADDTAEIIWPESEGAGFSDILVLIPKAVFTPIFFLGNWALRSAFWIEELS